MTRSRKRRKGDTRGIHISCLWPACEWQGASANAVKDHLRRKHKSCIGYGCDQCGFIDADPVKIQQHISSQHNSDGKSQNASLAFAKYCVSMCLRNDEELENLSVGDFWRKSRKRIKTDKLDTQDTCHLCQQALGDSSVKTKMSHLSRAHTVVIELDFDKLDDRNQSLQKEQSSSEPSLMSTLEFCADSPSDSDTESETACGQNNGKRQVNNQDPSICGQDDDFKIAVARETGIPAQTSSIADTSETEELKVSMLKCVANDFERDVRETFDAYETRVIAGNSYRVRKNLPILTISEIESYVRATQTSLGWACKVLGCGARFGKNFAMGLHLDAHGKSLLDQWYCGETTCATGKENVFETFGDSKGHVTKEHHGSKYSLMAMRHVPLEDVLVADLLKKLDLRRSALAVDANNNIHKELVQDSASDVEVPAKSTKQQDVPQAEGSKGVKARDSKPISRTDFRCPWPQCSKKHTDGVSVSQHIIVDHLDCLWQCFEEGCEHCSYRRASLYRRHRMNCHVGTPLQCDHRGYTQMHNKGGFSSRGHYYEYKLRTHFQEHFNTSLERGTPLLPSIDGPFSMQSRDLDESLASETSYLERFSGGSTNFFSKERKMHRRSKNEMILRANHVQPEKTEVRGRKTCCGFWFGHRHYKYVDSVELTLDASMLILVPSKLMFTVAPRCDCCICVMASIYRPCAQVPLPTWFGPQLDNKRQRIGIGKEINNNSGFDA